MSKKPKQTNASRTLVFDMLRGRKRYLALGAAAVLGAAFFSYMTPYSISVFVDYVIDNNPEGLPRALVNFLEGLGGREYLIQHLLLCAVIPIGFTLLNGGFSFLRGRSIAYAGEGAAKYLRDRLYDHLQNVPYDYYKHVSTGDLVQRCTSDVDTVRRFICMQLLEIVRTVTMLLVAAVILFSTNVTMALISTATLPLLCVSSFVYFRFVRRQFTLSDEAEGRMTTLIQENLTGVRVVRAFGQQKSELDRFTASNREYHDVTYKLNRMLAYYWGISDSVGYLQIGATLVLGTYFAVTSDFTLGNVLLFTTYTSMLTWPVRQLGRILADLGKASVSLNRLNEILSAPREAEPGAALSPKIQGLVEFDHVCFGYDRPDEVLKDVTFTVRPGETVAILGSTGSGKTSLVQLLQRLYECSAGHIRIDGVDVNDIERHTLRKNIGIVLQEPFLYSRTIRENIRITRPEAPEQEVYACASVACVHDVIQSFEQGYETVVGERGVTLSGGQKQRVAIARMLMQQAPILIFDDSLSAVDTETDAAIRAALSRRRKECTTFIISHRITTLMEADQILVLEQGRIVQRGTHEQLMAQPGLYARIAAIQTMEEGGENE